jgi:hypothetical protein
MGCPYGRAPGLFHLALSREYAKRFADVTQPLVGGHFSFNLVLPAGLCLLALIVWLLAKGLAEPPS